MKSFLLDREITTIEQVQVDMSEITESDIASMSGGQLLSFAHEAIKYLGNRIQDDPVIEINHSPVQAQVPLTEPRSSIDRSPMPFGTKVGKTSKYHYVYFTDNKYIASVTIKGKKIIVGQYEDELQAALIIDVYLDSINDQKRPRNRHEFPEIMDLYLQNKEK